MNLTHAIKSRKQIRELMSVYELESKNRLLLEYCIRTGLRISDILSVQVKDVHKKTHYFVTEKKTGKRKMVAINPHLQQSIKRYVKKEKLGPGDHLFYSNDNKGTHIQRMQAHRIIAHAGDMIGLVPLSAHSLRKTFGYWAYKQGIDISLLQTIFQHSSQAITLRYIDITQESIDEVYETVDFGF